MKHTRSLSLIATALIGLSTLHAKELQYSNASNPTVQVAGTTLAKVRNAVEVLTMLPGVTITSDGQIVVEGLNGIAIYIGTHKVIAISELYNLEATKIESVQVLTSPGAEYGKDVQAVIIVNVIKTTDDGFTLSNDLNVSINKRTSYSDELHLGYKHNRFNIGADATWSENNTKKQNNIFLYSYTDKVLTSAAIQDRETKNKTRYFTAQVNLGYDFNENNRLSFFYRTENIPTTAVTITGKRTTYNNAGGVTFREKPAMSDVNIGDDYKEHLHILNAEYHAKWGNWNIDLGHNSSWYKSDDHAYLPTDNSMLEDYNRDSYTIRTYVKTSVPLWKGTLGMGIEHNKQRMDVHWYDPSFEVKELHTYNGYNALAEYISLSQKWGKVSLSVGLRLAHHKLSYSPFEDDALYSFLMMIRDNPDVLEAFKKTYPNWETSIYGRIIKDGKIITRENHFYPNVSLSYDGSEHSTLSLNFSRSYNIAAPELSRLLVGLNNALPEKLLSTEHIYTTDITWKYHWMSLSATHNYYENPLCAASDDKFVYNGNDYHYMTWSLILSPKIGCWQPSLMLKFGKQWFDIELANGRTKMDRARGVIHFNNTISLPKDWIILANSEWYSKGDERNIYYYRSSFVTNLSIQKELLNKHLSLALKLNNVFHSSWTDFTQYERIDSGNSFGYKTRDQTTVTISAKYTL